MAQLSSLGLPQGSLWTLSKFTSFLACVLLLLLLAREAAAAPQLFLSGYSHPWGSWTGLKSCAAGSAVCGLNIRMEDPYADDVTAMNGLSIRCCSLSNWGTFQGVVVEDGWWGTWGTVTTCPAGKYAKAARIRMEPAQGGGDDTALNSVAFLCTDGTAVYNHRGFWGDWLGYLTCPASGAVIVGGEIRLESPQGGGDDAAATGFRFACACSSATVYPTCVAVSGGVCSSYDCVAFSTCSIGTYVSKTPVPYCTLGSTGCDRTCAACTLNANFQDAVNQAACKPFVVFWGGLFFRSPLTCS